MKLTRVLIVLCSCSLLTPAVQAVVPPTDLTTAINQVTTDSTLLSQWFSDQFRYVIPFNATTGMVVPKQLKIWGIELGVEGAVSGTKVDMDALRNLPTTLVDTRQVDNFDRFPFPEIIAHAKVGLPFGLDAGIRLGGIPKTTVGSDDSSDNPADTNTENTKVTLKNRIFGIDVRKKIVEEGVGKPGVTVGLNFTRVSGSIDATKDLKSSDDSTVTIAEGFTADYTTTLETTGGVRSEWDMNSFGVQAIVNKQILFMNPYVGASANLNSGSVSTAIDTVGRVTLSNPILGSESQTVSTRGVGSASANRWDIRGLAGVEFSILPFLKLGLQGEYAGTKNLGAALGLRAQFR